MALSLKEYLSLCLRRDNEEILNIIDKKTLSVYYRTEVNYRVNVLWENLSPNEISKIEEHMNAFLSNVQVGSKVPTKKSEKKNKHIRYIDISKKNIRYLLNNVDTTLTYRMNLLNFQYCYNAEAVTKKLSSLKLNSITILKEKLYKFLFIINEILHKNNFWRKYYNFEDRNNLIAYCTFNDNILSLLYNEYYNFYKYVEVLIEQKNYLPMYDIIHNYLINQI